MRSLTKAAKEHSAAVAEAKAAAPGSDAEQLAIGRVLRAGLELDKQLHKACGQGATPDELCAIEALHPSYIREIREAAVLKPDVPFVERTIAFGLPLSP